MASLATSKHVVITPTKHAIFMAFLAMVEEGDEVILPDPSWGTFEACARIAGAKVVAKFDPEKEYRMFPERVAEQVTKKTKMILINSPSNPLGSVMEKKDVKGIADICQGPRSLPSYRTRPTRRSSSRGSTPPSPRFQGCSSAPSP